MCPLLLRLTLLGCLGLAAGCKSDPAPSISVVGLRPEEPFIRYKPFNRWAGGGSYVWPKVPSLQPTLRWQGLPFETSLASDTSRFRSRIEDATYDLEIWLGAGDFPAQLVYQRNALTGTVHRVEHPLESHQTYFWTVRVRFRLGNETRVTEWSRIVAPEPALLLRREGFRHPDQRYYRFRTP
jgi:hypothetical protein